MDEFYNKHYIRLDSECRIIKGFSDVFEQPIGGDICINEQCGRHFEMMGVINLPLIDMQGVYLYKYVNGAVAERTVEEIQGDINAIVTPVSEAELLKAQVQALTAQNDFLEDCVAEIAMKVY